MTASPFVFRPAAFPTPRPDALDYAATIPLAGLRTHGIKGRRFRVGAL